jgi:hypothetical protein
MCTKNDHMVGPMECGSVASISVIQIEMRLAQVCYVSLKVAREAIAELCNFLRSKICGEPPSYAC